MDLLALIILGLISHELSLLSVSNLLIVIFSLPIALIGSHLIGLLEIAYYYIFLAVKVSLSDLFISLSLAHI